jgi:hypothetical protein
LYKNLKNKQLLLRNYPYFVLLLHISLFKLVAEVKEKHFVSKAGGVLMNRETQRQKLFSLLGDLPVKPDQIKVEKVEEEEKENYILESLLLDLNGPEF